MSYIQMTEEMEYNEAARYDRFDGYADVDRYADVIEEDVECIGRMTNDSGVKVEINKHWSGACFMFEVLVKREGVDTAVWNKDTKEEALELARLLFKESI